MHDFTLEIVTHNKYTYHVASLLFTAVDCGTLINPANGQVSHTAGTIFGRTATYTCDTGYNLVGDNKRICQSAGVWSGNAPTCQGELLISHTYTNIILHKKYNMQLQCCLFLAFWLTVLVNLTLHYTVVFSVKVPCIILGCNKNQVTLMLSHFNSCGL